MSGTSELGEPGGAPTPHPDAGRATIEEGRAILGLEFGSTRIKACLVDESARVLATGAHEWENSLVDGVWTYDLDEVWEGARAAWGALVEDAEERHGAAPASLASLGVSAMMHGYLVFDEAGELLAPFRTWRNTSTGAAAAELSHLFGVNIPLRWSIAHLHQAVLDGEPHLPRIRSITTLAGYVHERLTGRRVLGVGDASGMFPIDSATGGYDERMLSAYDARVARSPLAARLADLLPEVLAAGAPAGELTPEGAALLDPSGALRPGALAAPPEGDAGTGMVATDATAPRTGNVSAGTSIFAMVVLEGPLAAVHDELDLVTTPAGDPVAMVHCNNGASELAAWVGVFRAFSAAAGHPLDADAAYAAFFAQALEGAADAGGVLAYNQLSGEPIVGIAEGRPLVLRSPESSFTLPNLARAQLYGVFAALAIGMRVLGDEGVRLERMNAHGGIFRTAGVAQGLLATALGSPVAVAESAAEGGAWGMAVLAVYAAARSSASSASTGSGSAESLSDFLGRVVFAGASPAIAEPDADDASGFAAYLARYEAGLDAVRAAASVS